MKRVYTPHFVLIRAALEAIESYRPADKATFLAQPMAQDAILMRLQEIGENLAQIRRIDEAAYKQVADDSWIALIGLRNVISHGYHTINQERIWFILEKRLPVFTATLAAAEDDLGRFAAQ